MHSKILPMWWQVKFIYLQGLEKIFFKFFLGMTVRMEVMKMIVISVTSKSTKSLCELELCLNFK